MRLCQKSFYSIISNCTIYIFYVEIYAKSKGYKYFLIFQSLRKGLTENKKKQISECFWFSSFNDWQQKNIQTSFYVAEFLSHEKINES